MNALGAGAVNFALVLALVFALGFVFATVRVLVPGPKLGAIAAVEALGGDGGVVALVDGAPVWAFNTPGMDRAGWTGESEPVVSIFGDMA